MRRYALKFLVPAVFQFMLTAQEGARLTLLVTDSSGAAVPGAGILLRDSSHGFTNKVTTDGTGQYYFDFLRPGSYRMEVEKTGFDKYSIASLDLHARDSQTVRIQLQIAAATKSEVTVTGDYEGLQTDASTGVTLSGEYANRIPSNGRSFESLVLMTPGAVKANEPGGGLNVNGMRSNTNYYTVDGVSANTGLPASGGPAGMPAMGGGSVGSSVGASATGSTMNLISLDAVQEFRVQTSTFAPEFGRSPGAQISIISRGGSNQFHGSFSEYLRNDRFNSNDWFSNRSRLPRASMRLANENATLGGPIQHSRTFFFASFEGLGLTQPRTAIDTVPDVNVRRLAKAALRPYLNAFPIPNGQSLGSSAAIFQATYSMPSSSQAGSLRLDHAFGDGRNAFLRYSYSPSDNASRGGFSSSNTVQYFTSKTQTLTGSYSWLNREESINDVRINLSRTSTTSSSTMDSFGGAVVPADSTLFPPGYSSAVGSYSLNILGIGGFSKGQQSWNSQDQLNAVFSQTVSQGEHTYKAGFDYRLIMPASHSKPYSASVNFNGIEGDSDSGAFLSGKATNAFVSSSPSGIYSRYQNFAFYVQDTWKASEITTVTFGFRYDVNPAPAGRNGTKTPAVDSSYNLVTDRALYSTKWFNIAPRFGVSHQLNESTVHPMVFHGGIGIFYDTGYGTTSGAFSSAPNVSSNISSSVAFPLASSVLAAPALPPTKPYGMVTSADPSLSAPLVFEWNATVERWLGMGQVLSVGYVGTSGRRLIRQQTYPGFFSDQYQLLNYSTNGGDSDYNAMQVQYRSTLSRRLQAQVGYTWSHSLDTSSSDMGGGGFAILSGSERGNSNFDIRHSFNASASWQLPAPHMKILSQILGDWYVDGLVTARTGLPFDVQGLTTSTSSSSSTNAPSTGLKGFFAQVRPDYVWGQPLWISDPSAPGGKRLNRKAFAAPSSNTQGDLGRNSIRGFGQYQADLAIRRQIVITKRVNLGLRFEAFNALNHPLFADPSPMEGANLASPNFGVANRMAYNGGFTGVNVSQSNGAPRSIQFSMRLQF